jgi:hypothetical protein
MHNAQHMNLSVLRGFREMQARNPLGRLSQLARFQRDKKQAEKRKIAARAAARLAAIRGMAETRQAMVKAVAESRKQRQADAQQDKALKAHEQKIADIALTNKSHHEKMEELDDRFNDLKEQQQQEEASSFIVLQRMQKYLTDLDGAAAQNIGELLQTIARAAKDKRFSPSERAELLAGLAKVCFAGINGTAEDVREAWIQINKNKKYSQGVRESFEAHADVVTEQLVEIQEVIAEHHLVSSGSILEDFRRGRVFGPDGSRFSVPTGGMLLGLDALASLGLFAPGQTFLNGVYSTDNISVMTGGRKVATGDEKHSLDSLAITFGMVDGAPDLDMVPVDEILDDDGKYTRGALIIQGCVPEIAISPELLLRAPITAVLMQKFGNEVAFGATFLKDALFSLVGMKGGVASGNPQSIARMVGSFFSPDQG